MRAEPGVSIIGDVPIVHSAFGVWAVDNVYLPRAPTSADALGVRVRE